MSKYFCKCVKKLTLDFVKNLTNTQNYVDFKHFLLINAFYIVRFCVWKSEINPLFNSKLGNFNGSNVKSFIQMHILFLKVIRKWFYANIKKVSGTASDYKFSEHRATTFLSVDGKNIRFYWVRLTDRMAT